MDKQREEKGQYEDNGGEKVVFLDLVIAILLLVS
jgi:hypothetical protein